MSSGSFIDESSEEECEDFPNLDLQPFFWLRNCVEEVSGPKPLELESPSPCFGSTPGSWSPPYSDSESSCNEDLDLDPFFWLR